MTGLFDAGFAWGEAPIVAEPATVAATAEPRGIVPQTAAVLEPVAAVVTVAGWRAGLVEFLRLGCPDFMSVQSWKLLRADAENLGGLWAEEMLGFGWSVVEIFGWHPRPWSPAAAAGGPCGIIAHMGGRPLDLIGPDAVTITQRVGAPLVFRRQCPGSSAPVDRSGALPIWSALSPENLACRKV